MDEKIRRLEREALTDPEAAEALAVEQCRVGIHAQLIDETCMWFQMPLVPGVRRLQYPIRMQACLRCGWMEQRLDVKNARPFP